MYKLEFTLKQHTPLIHFQHNQDGATLRASEVKPKLDRFLIKKLELTEVIQEKGKEKIVPKKQFESLFNNKEMLSLDYKMSLLFTGKNTRYLVLSSFITNSIKNEIKNVHSEIDDILTDTSFFGNEQFLKIGRNRDNRKYYDYERSNIKCAQFAIFSEDLVSCKIMMKQNEFLNQIGDNLQEFFLLHNFGMRKTKGFGSFTLNSIRDKKLKPNSELFQINDVNYFLVSNSIQTTLKLISRTHRILKSGININWGENQEYEKAELFYYFAEYGVRWDKRFIKRNINQSKIENKELYKQKESTDFLVKSDDSLVFKNVNTDITENNSPYKFVRALLGLAEHYEFLIDNNGNQDTNKYIVDIEHVTSGDRPEKIERFNSPILYKVVDNVIYIVPKNIPTYLFQSLFRFNYRLKLNSNVVKHTDTIPIPSEIEFDLKQFLDYAFENTILNANKLKQ